MITIADLIQYWNALYKAQCLNWDYKEREMVRETIYALETLKQLKGE